MELTQNSFDLSNKTILLTGASGILGTRFIKVLTSFGANMALIDRNIDKTLLSIDELQLSKKEIKAKAYVADVTNKNDWLNVKRDVARDFGEVHVLINNAAAKSKHFFDRFEEYKIEDWEEVMDVNITGVMLGCQTMGAEMAKKGAGSIINLLSIYGIVGPDQRIYEGSSYEGRSINTPAVYSTSKAAVLGLTKYLATYWGEKGVRVNAITPGGIYSGQNDTFVNKYSARVPLKRMANVDDLNGVLVLLASDASNYITGQNFIVDGGLTAW